MERKDNKVYRVMVQEEDKETGKRSIIIDEKFVGFALTADCGDNKGCEVIVNDCLHDIAQRLAQSEKLSRASVLAAAYMHMAKQIDEDDLMKMIMED